tara:strand:- start:196 stop:804 length:609 start_codon:yes stop_codon:yes gene_type:complete
MPNWCRNQITIQSKDKKLIEGINNDLEGLNGKGLLHYMYPTPFELRDTTKGSHSVTNQKFIDKYGFDNWYDWALHNWGTKWDVYFGIDYEFEYKQWSGITLEFNSAWGPPLAVWQKFVDRYPKGTFEVANLQYIESGCQFCGVHDALDDTESVHVENYVDTFEDYASNKHSLDGWFSEKHRCEWLANELMSELEYLKEEEEQ